MRFMVCLCSEDWGHGVVAERVDRLAAVVHGDLAAAGLGGSNLADHDGLGRSANDLKDPLALIIAHTAARISALNAE
jgi:hypothetical protein